MCCNNAFIIIMIHEYFIYLSLFKICSLALFPTLVSSVPGHTYNYVLLVLYRLHVDNQPIHNHVDRTTKFHPPLLALSPTINNKKPSFRRRRFHCSRYCHWGLNTVGRRAGRTARGLDNQPGHIRRTATRIDALVRRARRNAIRLGAQTWLPLGSALSEGELDELTEGAALVEGELDGLPEGSALELGFLILTVALTPTSS